MKDLKIFPNFLVGEGTENAKNTWESIALNWSMIKVFCKMTRQTIICKKCRLWPKFLLLSEVSFYKIQYTIIQKPVQIWTDFTIYHKLFQGQLLYRFADIIFLNAEGMIIFWPKINTNVLRVFCRSEKMNLFYYSHVFSH